MCRAGCSERTSRCTKRSLSITGVASGSDGCDWLFVWQALTVTIEEEGRTRVIDRFIISAPVDGVACRVQLDVGDSVEQGQTLLSISPLESRVLDPRSRAEAEARVSAAK